MKQSLKFWLKNSPVAESKSAAQQRLLSIATCALLLICGARFAAAQAAPLPPGSTDPDAEQQPSDPLASIESAIDAKNYAQASSRLDVFLSAHPTSARALFDRGYIEDAQGHRDAAEPWYRKAIAADPKQFESRLALGLILAANGDPGAREQLQAAAQLEPNPPNPEAKAQADRALARLLFSTDPVGARDALVDALKLTPETPDDTLLTAQIADAAHDDEIAEQAYRKVLNENPNSSEATAGLAHVLISEKRYSEAEPLVQAALRRDPDDPSLNAQMAAIESQQGKSAEAVNTLEKLHQLEPKNREVASMLADAELQAGNTDQADALYQQLLAADPNNPAWLDAHGQILIREQKNAEALAAFRQAVAVKPDDADAWSGIAFADSELHQYQDELHALSMRSKYAPENPSTLFLWATAYDNLHQSKAAADFYHRFLDAAQGKFPDQEWQAKHRLAALAK